MCIYRKSYFSHTLSFFFNPLLVIISFLLFNFQTISLTFQKRRSELHTRFTLWEVICIVSEVRTLLSNFLSLELQVICIYLYNCKCNTKDTLHTHKCPGVTIICRKLNKFASKLHQTWTLLEAKTPICSQDSLNSRGNSEVQNQANKTFNSLCQLGCTDTYRSPCQTPINMFQTVISFSQNKAFFWLNLVK